jgi:chitinase
VPTPFIRFTVGDAESPASTLALTGTSSNTALVPNGNIAFFGGGARSDLRITPAAGQTGSTTITVTVSDPTGAPTSDTFLLTVSQAVTVGVSINDVSVVEGTTYAVFDVRLSSPSRSRVSVSYATGDGSATNPTDYRRRSGRLSFSPGQVSKTVRVLVLADTTPEDNETFFVNLTAPVGGVLRDVQAIGTILSPAGRTATGDSARGILSSVGEVTERPDRSFVAHKKSVLGEAEYDIHDAAVAAIVARRSWRWASEE